MTEERNGYRELRRGGYLAKTSAGLIQFGSPPETIKDTMGTPEGAPNIFVLPNVLFHVLKGITVAELEFPIYYNFFFRKKKTYIVCTKEQKEQFKIVLTESLFGPESINLGSEYINQEETFGFPNMQAEIDYFRGGRSLEDHVHFVIFNQENRVRINQVEIEKKPDSFVIHDARLQKKTEVPGEISFHIVYDTGKRLPEPYQPPLMAVTCLGPSHGFDPEDNTSGFILWINHQGIMVDPPVNSTEWLRASNVNPRTINSIILTHCHADHDAGTFQKILEEGKITIYTTETVIHSFIRKYNALTRIPSRELFTLFDFVPVVIGKSYFINGAEFRFNYALHSIPSLSFEFYFQNQSFIYSSDHLNEPSRLKELLDKNVLPEGRYKDLMDFPWHHSIVYHESGPPPLHTPIAYLDSLPEDIKKKTHVYHIARKDFPENSALTLCKFGIENTFVPEIEPPEHEEVNRLLDVLNNVDIFRDFPISKAREFISIVETESFARDTTIIHKDTPGDKFYIILSGNVKVVADAGGEPAQALKRYGIYEYFGEASLILDQPRNADIVAETDVLALTIEKSRFLNFIKGSDLLEKFTRLTEIRKTGTWEVLSHSRFFEGATSAQKTQLELLMKQGSHPAGQILIEEDAVMEYAYIIKSGEIEVSAGDMVFEILHRGDFVGELFQLQKNAPSHFEFKARTDVEVYAIENEALRDYIANNPGMYMRLNYVYGS